jgi:hypothetical protein
MEKLSKEEIDRRMIELYNYRRLYPELRQKYEQAKLRIQELEEALAREKREREESIETLKLQIEELREMVFGRKRGRGDDDSGHTGQGSSDSRPTKDKKPRAPASYRRTTPKDEDVTHETMHGIDCCPHCSTPLTNLRETVRYLEDIVIPALAELTIVEKQRIETGFCTQCRKWHSAIPIRKQVCSLGENVRGRIVYCITVLGMTFEKVERDLKDTFGITVGNGELTHILTTEAAKLLPEYHDIDVRICGAPAAHYDETSHPVQKEGQGQHGWVKTASDSPDTIFRLGQTRGKGNAKALIHHQDQPIITDDYSAYDGLSDKHGLCWAHPKRKFQDLAESSTLTDDRRLHCQKFYERFCTVVGTVKTIVHSPYDRQERAKEADRCRPLIGTLMTPSVHDPKKLATLKKTFLSNTEHYLLCILEPNIPMTNNKAERAIRPLVIKRKLSFGSKTQKGADVMSILLSVCLTTWWKQPDNFYAAYGAIVRKWQAA